MGTNDRAIHKAALAYSEAEHECKLAQKRRTEALDTLVHAMQQKKMTYKFDNVSVELRAKVKVADDEGEGELMALDEDDFYLLQREFQRLRSAVLALGLAVMTIRESEDDLKHLVEWEKHMREAKRGLK